MHKITAFLFTIISLTARAQFSDTATQIEKIFRRYTAENPGSQLSISRNGVLLFSKAWGKSNLEDNIALTTHSLIEAGSVSKQFTAACILLLEQQGKLSLQDNIRKYFPELPDYGTVIKVKHLIHHTSGLKDWGTVAELTGFGRFSKAYRNEDALEIVARQKTLNNIPGAEFIYSNSNYNLLAILIQRVSGMSLADYSAQYIFKPAGMTQTQWRDDFRRIVPHRAVAYAKTSATTYVSDMPNEYVYGNGGLLTTTEDLLKWNDYYLSGKFGQPSLLTTQITTDTLNNKRTNFYAAGLFIQTSKGKKVIRHDGATGSYRCYLSHYPELQLSVAWLSNTSQFDTANNIASTVEDLFIKRPPSRPAEEKTEFKLSPEKLQSYAGLYRNSRTASAMQLTITNGQLTVDSRTVLKPIADGKFQLGSDILVFDPEKNFVWTNDDYDSVRYTPTLSAEANLKPAAYTGKFFSEEANATINITEKDGSLYMELNSYTSYRLQPIYRDGFRITGFGGYINFRRMKSDEIRQFYVSQGRARNVLFAKPN